MTELLPLGLRVLAVIHVRLFLTVGDEPRVTVVIDLDDGGIEVRIGPGVILRSGSEDKQLNIKISQIYLSVADKIARGPRIIKLLSCSRVKI